MDQELQTLVQLQRIDSTIDALNSKVRTYPQRKSVLEEDLGSSEQELQDERHQMEELEKEQRHYERELQNINHDLEKHNKRLFEIKNNVEYQALLKEIDQLKGNIGECEEQILKRMTTLDDLTSDLKEREERFQTEKEKTDREIQELETELAEVRKELDHWQQKREKLVVRVQHNLLRTYERVRGKNKVAVVAVQKGSCGGCFERLPPQRINEIRRNERLIYCENCGSILVWDEEGVLNNHHNEKQRKERPEQNR